MTDMVNLRSMSEISGDIRNTRIQHLAHSDTVNCGVEVGRVGVIHIPEVHFGGGSRRPYVTSRFQVCGFGMFLRQNHRFNDRRHPGTFLLLHSGHPGRSGVISHLRFGDSGLIDFLVDHSG